MLGHNQTGGRAEVLFTSGVLFTYTWLETSRQYQYRLSFILLQIAIDSSDLWNNRLAHLLQTSGCWLLTSQSDDCSVAHAVILKTSEYYERSTIKLECSLTELKAVRRKPFGLRPEGPELIGSPEWWIVTGGQTVLALTGGINFYYQHSLPKSKLEVISLNPWCWTSRSCCHIREASLYDDQGTITAYVHLKFSVQTLPALNP